MDQPTQAVRTAVVTGASAGVGHAVALELAARGYRVALMARGVERLQQAARRIEHGGGRAMAVPVDVADADAVEVAMAAVVERLGAPDLLVNNAMVTVFAPVSLLSAREFEQVTRVTYLGAVHATMAALRAMRRRGGTIAFVSSALAYRGIPLQSAYCGAKFALRGFVDSLRVELAHERVPVTLSMAHLPAVDTPQFDWARNRLPGRPRPVGKVFAPEAVARAIVDAAEAGTRDAWIGAPTVQLVLGDAVAPEIVDRRLEHEAIAGQCSDQPADRQAPDNLFAPAQGAARSSGRFGDEARSRVASVSSTGLRNAAALAIAGLVAWSAVRGLRRRPRGTPGIAAARGRAAGARSRTAGW